MFIITKEKDNTPKGFRKLTDKELITDFLRYDSYIPIDSVNEDNFENLNGTLYTLNKVYKLSEDGKSRVWEKVKVIHAYGDTDENELLTIVYENSDVLKDSKGDIVFLV